jgi:hypothetical protein
MELTANTTPSDFQKIERKAERCFWSFLKTEKGRFPLLEKQPFSLWIK